MANSGAHSSPRSNLSSVSRIRSDRGSSRPATPEPGQPVQSEAARIHARLQHLVNIARQNRDTSRPATPEPNQSTESMVTEETITYKSSRQRYQPGTKIPRTSRQSSASHSVPTEPDPPTSTQSREVESSEIITYLEQYHPDSRIRHELADEYDPDNINYENQGSGNDWL